MCRLPEPVSAIARRLHAEKPPIPFCFMDEANVLDRKIELLPLLSRRPGKVRIFELLPEPRNLDRVRRREENLEAYGIAQHCPIHPAAYSSRK